MRCTPEEAFDSLSDHRYELEWNPRVQEIGQATDGPVGLGTTYRAKWKAGPHVVVETVAYDRPASVGAAQRRPDRGPRHLPARAGGGGTELTADSSPPHGWFRLLFPLFRLNFQRRVKREEEHGLPEGGAAAPGRREGEGLSRPVRRRRRWVDALTA